MKSSANQILKERLKADNYLRSTFVLGIDMIVSIIASAIVVTFAKLLELAGTGETIFSMVWILAAIAGSFLGFIITKSYEGIIRHSTLRELSVICEAIVVKELTILIASAIFIYPTISPKAFWILPAIDFLVSVSALVMIRISMVLTYDFITGSMRVQTSRQKGKERMKVLVYGVGDKSVSLTTRFLNSSHYDILGYLTRKDTVSSKSLSGKTIYKFSGIEDLLRIKDSLGLEGIMFPIPNFVKAEENGLVEYARHLKLKLYVAPSVDELKEGDVNLMGMRDIKIEDLLGREEIDISLDEVKAQVGGKTILVTGAAGSIGSELCRQLAHLGIRKLIMFDNAETPLHNIRLEFEDKFKWVDFQPVIGDVRSKDRVDFLFSHYKPDIVFHAAAYKHVPLMEENPCEAMMVNVEGSRNIADKCVEYGVQKMVMVSTDKAVNPTNIMGCTKRLAEIYVQSLGLAIENGKIDGVTNFVTTRFGNVLGSNGSVIPRFKEQIAMGGPVTVTHPEIRRFFMTIPEACRLVLEAATLSRNTHIYAFDMGQPVRISDLAVRMIKLAGYEIDKDIKITYTGLRPGEKLYEEVLADKENTVPTSHKRIFEARVREYEYETIVDVINRMVNYASHVSVPDMVILMKKTVPEFKSRHSAFEKYDKEDLIDQIRYD